MQASLIPYNDYSGASRVSLPSKQPDSALGWHHQDIVSAVRKRGSSLAELSRRRGYARSTLHASLYRQGHHKAHAIIARFLDVTRHAIWPRWYGPDDRPLPPLNDNQPRTDA